MYPHQNIRSGMHHRNTLNISRIHPRNLGLKNDLHKSHLGNIWHSCGIHMGSTWETCVMYLRKTWVPYWIPDKSHMGPILFLNPFSLPMWIPHVYPICGLYSSPHRSHMGPMYTCCLGRVLAASSVRNLWIELIFMRLTRVVLLYTCLRLVKGVYKPHQACVGWASVTERWELFQSMHVNHWNVPV